MKITRNTGKAIARTTAISAAAVTMFGLSACGSNSNNYATTPDGMCGYTVGTGNQDGHGNRTINHVIYPSSSWNYNASYDMVRYFPCGPRNLIVAPGSGDLKVDDQHSLPLPEGRTKLNTVVLVELTVYWTPNREDVAMRQFLQLCMKYECASGDLGVGSANFSQPGWMGMLRENMDPVINRLVAANMPAASEEIWTNNDQKQRDNLAAAMSAGFAAEMQKTTGYDHDIFCGSGSTGNADKFDCQNVRIVVDKVYAKDQTQQDQVQQQAKLQQMIDSQAKADQVYGPLAPQVRACQDLAAAKVPVNCVIGGDTVQVQVPAR